jgi:hypothetical protein
MKDKKAKSFVVIMVAIALSAFLLRIFLERVIKISITRNESQASVTLKLISVALENYAKEKEGAYPSSLFLLSQEKPPYLEKEYLNPSLLKGYNYSCSRLEPEGYRCSASPNICGLTGKIIYTITTSGLFVSEECRGKE